MGYYTGNGVVTGGGESVSPINAYYKNNAQHTVHRKTKTVVTVKNGVDLATAQAATGDESLEAWWADSTWVPSFTPAAKGSRTTQSYSRISDSNLYALTTTAETFTAKLDSGSYS